MKRFRPFTPSPARRRPRRLESGQALIIIALAFVGIAAFVGLAIDLGIFLVAQAHLRRGIDSAAIAAASQMREGTSFLKIGEFTAQFIRMNNIDVNTVYVSRCLTDPVTKANSIEQYSVISGTVANYSSSTPEYTRFSTLCTSPPRKLIRVDAAMDVRFSFLPIIGFYGTTATADATSEAAAIDLVIVFGTGETMGQATPDWTDPDDGQFYTYFSSAFSPNAHCNPSAGPDFEKQPNFSEAFSSGGVNYAPKCRPLWDAKQAAKRLLNTLYYGYDRVAIVNYDFRAYYSQVSPSDPDANNRVLSTQLGVDATASTDSTGAYKVIDELVLRDAPDDAPSANTYNWSRLNVDCTIADTTAAACFTPSATRATASSCAGCGIRVAANILKQFGRPEAVWVIIFLSDGNVDMSDIPDSVLGTGSDPLLKTNVQPFRFPDIPSEPLNYNGFCQGKLIDPAGRAPSGATSGLWSRPLCLEGTDQNTDGVVPDAQQRIPNYETVPDAYIRFCGPFRDNALDCPPGSVYVGQEGYTQTIGAVNVPMRSISGTLPGDSFTVDLGAVVTRTLPAGTRLFYNVYDYARDQVDFAALTTNCIGNPATACRYGTADPYNDKERARGSNIVVYSIGVGDPNLGVGVETLTRINFDSIGERLLRYMAAVGDDGDRVTDLCSGVTPGVSCGNYYYAPSPSALGPVFEDIARRIFTRLAR
jgi:Flp pilus assembly protein TadG